MKDTRMIFAISPGAREGERPFAFVDVLGEIIDGRLCRVDNVRTEFPNVGNIFLSADYWLPPLGVSGMWRVRRTRTADEGGKQAEYSAVERGRALPLEIVAISGSAASPEELRHTLLQGVTLEYNPASAILILLTDGVVLGPIRCEANSRGFSCTPDALRDPLGLWNSIDPLEPMSFVVRGEKRIFSTHTNLPAPSGHFDCSELDHAVRSIVRLLKDARDTLTKKQLDKLSHAVNELAVAPRLAARLSRVQHALASSSLTIIELEQFAQLLAEAPDVQRHLEEIKTEARELEKKHFAEEQSSLTKAVQDLRKAKTQLGASVRELQRRVASADTELLRVVGDAEARVRERIDALREGPAELLSEIALLRPFLKTTDEPRARTDTGYSLELAAATSVVDLRVATDLVRSLETNLSAIGLVGGSARTLAREVAAAARSGQMIILSGSLALPIARACGRAVATLTLEVSVPVGLLDGREVNSVMQHAVTVSNSTNTVTAVVFEGMNRSATDAYLQCPRSLVVDRQLSLTASGPILFGTLADGPSALPLVATHCELGPVFDTDTLALMSKLPSDIPDGGRISCGDWETMIADVGTRPALPADLLDAMEGERSLLWRRGVANAHARLVATGDETVVPPLSSLAFGWLLPRAHAAGVEGQAFLETLRTALGTEPDRRIEKLISRWYGVES